MNFYRFGYYFSSLISIVLALTLITEKRAQAPHPLPKIDSVTAQAAPTASLPAKPLIHPAPSAVPTPPSASSSAPGAGTAAADTEAPSPSATQPAQSDRTQFRVSARISAIEKFVQVNDSQRDRLRQKFSDELTQTKTPDQTESLDDILGAENAQYYKDQVKQAVSRAKDEESERELYYQSRKLGLSAEQEDLFRGALQSTEAQVEQQSQGAENSDMHARMQQMLRDEALRQQLLDQRLAQILSAEQYQRYLEQQQQSSSADFQVFHDAGH